LGNIFGSPQYALEELRAQVSSFFISAQLHIPFDVDQNAAYISSWCDALRSDHNLLFKIAKDASKIADYVLQFQHEKTLTTEAEPRKPSEKAAEALSFLKKARSKEVELEC
jgi:antirestriction protein ArdC